MKTLPIDSPWLDSYQQQLKYIALTLGAVGVLNLLAANWFYFPVWVQLYLPQLLLLLGCVTAAVYSPNSSLGHGGAIIAAVMTGLALACYGQVYQTGADSYQLFLLWSIFLLPWLLYRLSSVYVLFCIISSLTLYLIGQQMLYLSTNMLIILSSGLCLLQVLAAELWFKPTRLIILLPIAIFAIGSAVTFTINYNFYDYDYFYYQHYHQPYWWLSAFVLPLVIAAFYYWRKWSVGLACMGLTLAICSSIYILVYLFFKLESSSSSIAQLGITVAMLLFAWCYLITVGLRLLLPNAITLASMPVAFGAWLSSLLLFICVFLLSSQEIILSVAILIAAAAGIKYSNKLFLRQAGYALFLCSQAAIFFWLDEFTYNYGFYHFYYAGPIPQTVLFQSLVVVGSWLITTNQFWRSLQLSTLLMALYLTKINWFDLILPLSFIIWLVFPAKVQDKNWLRPILISLLVGIVFNAVMWLMRMPSHLLVHFISYGHMSYIAWLLKGLFIGLTALALYQYRRDLNPVLMLIFAALALILVWLALFDLFLLLAALVIVCQQKDHFLLGCAMLALAVYLSILYYCLSISFIIKGGVLIISGLILAIVATLIARQLIKESN